MKKILTTALCLFMLNSCQAGENGFKGKNYVMDDNGVVITLNFDRSKNSYSGKIVNNYFGEYTADNDNITFQPAGATMMMGSPEEMKTEIIYFQTLPLITRYKLEEKKLILYTTDGQELIFEETNTISD